MLSGAGHGILSVRYGTIVDARRLFSQTFSCLGSCEWDGPHDSGVHSVCAQMTNKFLDFTRSRGNDLSTPRGSFPGLREGDRWCLCAGRWKEALNANAAPPVVLRATHRISLQHVKIDDLRKLALGNTSRRRIQTKS